MVISKNIILTGMRGSGKTRIGKELAKNLKKEFIDIDDYIIEIAGKKIPEIVKESGWEGFRKFEKEACLMLKDKDNLVIATGGGTVLYKENVKCMKEKGTVVFLTVDISELKLRLKHSKNRPPLKKDGRSFLDELDEIWKERKKAYLESSDMVYDASKNTGNKKKDILDKAKEIAYLLKEK